MQESQRGTMKMWPLEGGDRKECHKEKTVKSGGKVRRFKESTYTRVSFPRALGGEGHSQSPREGTEAPRRVAYFLSCSEAGTLGSDLLTKVPPVIIQHLSVKIY